MTNINTFKSFICANSNSQYNIDLDNLVEYGISWCEGGQTATGKSTTLCAECQHYASCDAIHDLLNA